MKRVILVRPIGPRNAGMVLRAAANFGPAECWFVAPRRPSLLVHPEFEQMAHGVRDVHERVQVVGTLEEALDECTGSVGFTARARDGRLREDWREARESVGARCDEPDERIALVFGSDEGGLSREECALLERLCYLPTAQEHTSLNLAMAVSVVLASIFGAEAAQAGDRPPHLIDGHAREFLKAHLKDVFVERVAQSPAARRDIAGAIDRIFSQAPIENRDARAWHVVLRALGSRKTPGELGLPPAPRQARRDEARARAEERRSR